MPISRKLAGYGDAPNRLDYRNEYRLDNLQLSNSQLSESDRQLLRNSIRTRLSSSRSYRKRSLGSFFIYRLERKDIREDVRQSNLLKHYQDLNNEVFKPWQKLELNWATDSAILAGDEVVRLKKLPLPLYMYVWGPSNQTKARSTISAVLHLASTDPSRKYGAVILAKNNLGEFQDKHNVTLSSLLEDVEREISQMLLKFPDIPAVEDKRGEENGNYCFKGGIVFAIFRSSPIIFQQSYIHDATNNSAIAYVKETQRRDSLMGEIRYLIAEYQPKLETLRNDDARVRVLIQKLGDEASVISDQIEYDGTLDGTCEVEEHLKK